METMPKLRLFGCIGRHDNSNNWIDLIINFLAVAPSFFFLTVNCYYITSGNPHLFLLISIVGAKVEKVEVEHTVNFIYSMNRMGITDFNCFLYSTYTQIVLNTNK